MVEHISANQQSRTLADALLSRRADAAENVEAVNAQAARSGEQQPAATLSFLDNADVSDKARQLLSAARYGKLAMEGADADVLSRSGLTTQLRAMVEAGRLSELTRRYDNAALADSLLNSPTGAFLR